MADAATAAAAAALRCKELGNAAYAARKYANALTHYTRAIELDPANPTATHIYFANRSGVLVDLGRGEEAESDARECVARAPAWPKGYYRLGAALEARARLPDALAAFDEGLALEPGNADLVRGRERVAARAATVAAADARAAAADVRPSFLEGVLAASQLVEPIVAGAPGAGPELGDLVAAFPRVRIEGAPGRGGRGRRLVATRPLPAFTEVFTEVAALWVGPLVEKFPPLAARVAEQPPRGVGPLAAVPAGGEQRALDHLLLQLEPFATAGSGAPEGAALPPLTRGELFQRAIRQNAFGAVFDENAKGGPRLMGVLSPVAAMMNHDCDANATTNGVWDAAKGAVAVRVSTIRDVEEGEELTISYVPRKLPRSTRAGILLERYGFACVCARCLSGVEDTVVFACPHCDDGRVFMGATVCADCGADVGAAAAEDDAGEMLAAAREWAARPLGLVEVATATHHGVEGGGGCGGAAEGVAAATGCPLHITDVGRLDRAMAALPEAWTLPRPAARAVAHALLAGLAEQPMTAYLPLLTVPLGHVLALAGDGDAAMAVYAAAAARVEAQFGRGHALSEALRALAGGAPPATPADIERAERRRAAAAEWTATSGLRPATLQRWLNPIEPRGPAVRAPGAGAGGAGGGGGLAVHPEDSRALRILAIVTARIDGAAFEPGRNILAVEASATVAPSAAELEAAGGGGGLAPPPAAAT